MLSSVLFFVAAVQHFTTSAFMPRCIPISPPLHNVNRNSLASQHRRISHLLAVKSVGGPFSANAVAGVWGREPLLIRNAFDSTELVESTYWPSWDDVMELANDADAASRLIRHTPGQLDSFTLDVGPFAEADLRRLSTQRQQDFKWTIVVNDVDRFCTPLTDWMDEVFCFLPRWRRDDGQISLAGKGGGIGPHVDNYDVFLIQTSGTRLWEIGNDKMSVEDEMNTMIPGIDVRILQPGVWNAQDVTSLELQPGDLLYLPPRTIHCGTALSDDCMTLSVGCRTPSASELASRVVEALSTSAAEHAVRRYVDHDFFAMKDSSNGLLSTQVRDRMKQLVLEAVHRIVEDDAIFDETVGRLVTEPKRYRENYPVPWQAMSAESPWQSPHQAIEAARQGTACFFRTEGISFAFSMIHLNGSDGAIMFRLYADGEVFELEQKRHNKASATRLLSAICTSPFDLNEAILEQLPPTGDVLLEQLLVKGFLYVAPEDDDDEDEDQADIDDR